MHLRDSVAEHKNPISMTAGNPCGLIEENRGEEKRGEERSGEKRKSERWRKDGIGENGLGEKWMRRNGFGKIRKNNNNNYNWNEKI